MSVHRFLDRCPFCGAPGHLDPFKHVNIFGCGSNVSAVDILELPAAIEAARATTRSDECRRRAPGRVEAFEGADVLAKGLAGLVDAAHGAAKRSGWWSDLQTGKPIERNVGELLALIHSEISEALEAHRKGRKDDHLPDRPGIEVELADAVIRIADLCGGLGLDLAGAVVAKMSYNAKRADHRPDARRATGGKAY